MENGKENMENDHNNLPKSSELSDIQFVKKPSDNTTVTKVCDND